MQNATEATPQRPSLDWRRERRSGLLILAVSGVLAAGIWVGVRNLAPLVPHAEAIGIRMTLAFKWWCIAVLLCFATGIDAVAHERLQSPAFNPLVGYETKRLQVNLRYLQNTLEQLILFTAALFGLALYSSDGDSMRAVEATAVVWILFRFAFWIGYHRSATLRTLGAASIGLSWIVLIHVAARASFDIGGSAAVVVALGLFAAIQAILFWTTRFRPASSDGKS